MKTAEDILKEKKRTMICVGMEATVFDVIKTMVDRRIGAIIVRDGEKIVGIFTERDFIRQSVREGFDPKTTTMEDAMSKDLVAVPFDASIPKLQDIILGKCVRHLLVQKEGRYIGLLSAGDVTRADINEKTKTLASVSWDYYENWRWDKDK